MPHVNETQRACLSAAVLALALLAGCTDSTRRPPLLAEPVGPNLAARLAPAAGTGRHAVAVVGAPIGPPPATTALSLRAGRRA